MNKKTLGIATALICCFGAMFALTGCDALGLTITERGIQGSQGTLIGLICVIVVLVVIIQRLFER